MIGGEDEELVRGVVPVPASRGLALQDEAVGEDAVADGGRVGDCVGRDKVVVVHMLEDGGRGHDGGGNGDWRGVDRALQAPGDGAVVLAAIKIGVQQGGVVLQGLRTERLVRLGLGLDEVFRLPKKSKLRVSELEWKKKLQVLLELLESTVVDENWRDCYFFGHMSSYGRG